MFDIITYLESHALSFQCFEHPAVFTCEQAALHLAHVPGKATKNLFLRNKKGDMHILVSVPDSKPVDLKALSEKIGLEKLGFASPERLMKFLGVEPGSVTLLGLVNDTSRAVRAYIDSDLWSGDALQCHPLRNTATLVISKADLQKFFELTGHQVEIIEVPTRLEA